MDATALESSLKSQYLAALKTLKSVIDLAPEGFLYADRAGGVPPWQVAVHTYWFTELYLADGIEGFSPCAIHREENHLWSPIPWENNRMPRWGEPATRDELLGMHEHLCGVLAARIAANPLDSATGFNWIPGTRLANHIYNIRHIQHHAAQLISRLRQAGGPEVGWVRSGM